ncbi:MAG: DMT family transporter [Azospirillaceae bacterium]
MTGTITPADPGSAPATPPPGPLRTDNRVAAGIAWMLLAGVLFTAMSAIMKHLGETIPTAEIVFFRMAAGLAVVVPVALIYGGRAAFHTRHPLRHAIRSFFGASSLGCAVYALGGLPFATATALAFTTPLWVIVLAALFLRERPSLLAVIAAAVGFSGVLVIAQPSVVIELAVVVAIAGAVLAGGALTMVRSLSARDRSLAIVFWFSLYGTLYSLPPALLDWVMPTPFELLLLSTTGLLGVTGLFCSAQAYRQATAAFVAPADFVRLPLAGLIGLLVFGELPSSATLGGTLLIVLALAILLGDARRRNPAPGRSSRSPPAGPG